jgi:hypothetical protein
VGGVQSLSKGGMENRRSKALPQIGQSKVFLGKVGACAGKSSASGAWVSDSSSSRRLVRSRR